MLLQAAVQSLIDKLEPLFPEIAGMTVSSDGLVEAIHGCELRLVHAHEAVLVRSSMGHPQVLLCMAACDAVKVVIALVLPPLWVETGVSPGHDKAPEFGGLPTWLVGF